MTLKYFMHYLDTEGQKEDSPLYIFDSSFGRRKKSKTGAESRKTNSKKRECLLKDYKIPPYFVDDLFHLTGDRRRPPYRWFLIGGERSGTGIHVDPLGTSAWNTLLVGHKRWCMFPPTAPRKLIDPPMRHKDHEAVTWFTHVFPRLVNSVDGGKSLAEEYGMLEVLQKPGETIFVPGGWHHVVMNLVPAFQESSSSSSSSSTSSSSESSSTDDGDTESKRKARRQERERQMLEQQREWERQGREEKIMGRQGFRGRRDDEESDGENNGMRKEEKVENSSGPYGES
ncbi:5296_t:CDS:2, partial [Acaulospora colombiana]